MSTGIKYLYTVRVRVQRYNTHLTGILYRYIPVRVLRESTVLQYISTRTVQV